MKLSARKSQYSFLPFLAMLLVTNSALLHLFEPKTIWINTILLGNFFSPLTFIINDMIAEIYGYQVCIRIFWYLFLCRLIFTGLCTFFINCTYALNDLWSYDFIFFQAWHAALVNPMAFLIAWIINARLILKWKILLKGRYFWLRSLGSSGIAETLFAIIIFLMPPYDIGIHRAAGITFWLIILRLFFSAIFAFPASLFVNALKTIEKVDSYDSQNNFNPFKKEKSTEM